MGSLKPALVAELHHLPLTTPAREMMWFHLRGERIQESSRSTARGSGRVRIRSGGCPAGWLVTALLESQSGRRPAGRSPITRSLSSLATTPRSRNSAIIKLITTRIATKTLLKLASRYLARKSGTGGPACRSPYPRLASGIATLKM